MSTHNLILDENTDNLSYEETCFDFDQSNETSKRKRSELSDYDDDDDDYSDEIALALDDEFAEELQSCKPRKKRLKCDSDRIYGLRPRTTLRRPSYDCDSDDKEQTGKKNSIRSKTRSPIIVPKCRRLTANARERQRMKEINDAFSTLRGILPNFPTRPAVKISMTKIRTLRLAASYIQALSDLLSDSEPSEAENAEDVSIETVKLTSPKNLHTDKNKQTTDGGVMSTEPNNKHDQETSNQVPNEYDNRSDYWNTVQASDEELFSMLEKEIVQLKSQQLQNSTVDHSHVSAIHWHDDILS